MPQVPIYQQQVGGTNAGFQQDLNSDPYGMRVPMNHDIGNGLTQAAKLAKQYQDDLDESFVYQKLNDLKRYAQDQRTGENGYLKLKGYDAIARDDEGYGLAERTDKALKSYGDSLQESLTPRQKKLFAKSAMGIYDQQYGFASQHVMVQSDAFSNGQDDGTIDTANRVAAQNVGNPDVFNDQINDTIRATMRKARRNGWSEEQTQAEIEKNVSNLVYEAGMSAIQSAQTPEEQIEKVSWIKDSYGKYLRGTQLAGLTASLNKAGDDIIVRSMSDTAIGELSRDPTQFDLIFNSAVGLSTSIAAKDRAAASIELHHFITDQESGGRQTVRDANGNLSPLIGRYADGTLPAVGKRAYGASQMQLKTAEAAAKEAGIPWNPQAFVENREYNLKIGRAWMNHLLEAYDGDTAKAIVAYHNGETDVNQAVKAAEAEAKKTGKPVDWLDKLKLNGGKEYLAAVQKRVKAAQSPEVIGPDGTKYSFFDGKQATAAFRKVPEKDLREYLKRINPIYETRPDLLDSTVKAFQAKEDARLQSYVTEQNNLRADIIENYLAKGKSYEEVPESLRSQLNLRQQKEVSEMFDKVRRKDFSGDEHLAAVLLNDPQQWASYTEDEMKATLYRLPEDKREALKAKWYAANVKAQVADENLKALQFRAQKGEYVDAFSSTPSSVREALKLSMGKDWPDKTEEQNQLVADMMQVAYDAGVMTGSPIKTASGLMENADFKNAALTRWKQKVFWWHTNKNPMTLKYGDLPDKGRADVRTVLQGMADNYRHKRGLEGSASEGEVMAYFRRLVYSKDPDVDLIGVNLDKATVDFYKKNFPGESTRDMIIRYVRDAVAGEYVKDDDVPLISENAQAYVNALGGEDGPRESTIYSYDNEGLQ